MPIPIRKLEVFRWRYREQITNYKVQIANQGDLTLNQMADTAIGQCSVLNVTILMVISWEAIER